MRFPPVRAFSFASPKEETTAPGCAYGSENADDAQQNGAAAFTRMLWLILKRQ